MSLYKEFSSLLPYLQSVRKLDAYLSFDVSFPKTWKLPKKYIEEDKILEQESTIIDNRFFSFVSEITEEGVENTSKNIQNIIKYNLEREEKEKLFQNKVDELKHIFEKQNLKNLKSLQFEIKNNKLELEYDEEELESARVVPERINKGQD
jgi:hypothetical protein